MKSKLFALGICCMLFAACGSKTENSPSTPSGTETKSESESAQPAAEGRYKAGDVLYCYAPSGLVLRDKPDQAGAKLASIPQDAKVEVKDDAPFTTAFSVKEPCGLEIKGFWVKVAYQGKEGYMFDGYLLKLRPMNMDETVQDFWSTQGKLTSSTDKAPKDDVNYYSYEKSTWDNGVSYESSGYEGGSNSKLVLPKSMFTFQEAYLIAISSLGVDPENPFKCTCDAGKQNLECQSKDELAFTSVETDKAGNFVIIDSYAD